MRWHIRADTESCFIHLKSNEVKYMRTGLRQQSNSINVSSLLIVIAESITTFFVTQSDVCGNEALGYLGVCCCSVALSFRLFEAPWTVAPQAFLSCSIFRSLLKLMSIESVMLSNHLILCHPFLLLPSIFPSIRVFSSELALCIRWPKYWSFHFNTSLSNEYSGLISFRIEYFDLLAVRGTLKGLLQHHSLKASVLGAQPSLWSKSHICTCLLEKP